MKKLLYMLLTLAFAGFIGSCTIQKRHYMHGFHVSRAGKKAQPTERISNVKPTAKPEAQEVAAVEIAKDETKAITVSASAGKNDLELPLKKHLFNFLPPDSCDNLIMKNGEEVSANVIEIGVDVIKYRKCDHPDGPVYSARKSDIFMVKYKNGRKEVIESTTSPQQASTKALPQKKRLLPAALISFLSALVSLFIAGILLGTIAVVLGIVALVKINRFPDLYKGTGFAVAGLIIGLIAVVLTMALLATI